jgi:hypothetical protein
MHLIKHLNKNSGKIIQKYSIVYFLLKTIVNVKISSKDHPKTFRFGISVS